MSTNRIPLNVDHYGHQSRGGGGFGMDNMMDETERIKSRMREFEERCRKWREEVFGKTSLINEDMSRKSEYFDQRVPFADTTTKPATSAGPTAAPPTTHKTYIEDCANGSKKYRIDVQIGDYKQNELMLSSDGTTLIIKGDRELVNGSSTEKKSFNREITLPDYVDMSKLSANLIEAPSSATSFNNQLEIEAPIIMQKYSYRRSAFDKSPKQTNFTSTSAPKSSTSLSDGRVQTKHQSHTSKSTTTTSSSSTTTNTTAATGNTKSDQNRKGSVYDLNMNIEDSFGGHGPAHQAKSSSAELMPGYPVYDSDQGCVVYKFDLRDFDQSDIQLTVTVDRTLEIKATKQQVDTYGKVYHEFKREIVLEPEVDANLIKNVLHEGILTIKIAKATNSDGVGSVSNNHNLQAPNGFKEIYTDDGALTKLNADFKGYKPENVKIVLSANNVLKVSASQQEVGANNASVQKECSRQYTLPNWVQPENMKATMSRDGLLTVDFLAKK